MTALVFALQPDQVCIAMDTLVIGADDRMPMAFQSKFLPVPESDLVVAGTGRADFINGWFLHLGEYLHGATIDELDAVVPDIFRSSVSAAGGLGGLTATIYHFGYSVREQRYVGYAYRSEQNFCSDRLPYALGLKPVVQVHTVDDIRFPGFLIEIMLEQQRQDLAQPLCKRLGIGGDIEFVVMSDRTIHAEIVHRFSSYESEVAHVKQRVQE